MQNNELLHDWSETAGYWRKHCETIRTMFTPLTQALIKEAGIVAGNSVLDIAAGAGEPSLTIAEVVGLSGSVTCTDAIEEMVETARAEAQRRGISNVAFQRCTADSLPFADESFDAVVCRLGAMFFPDPVTGLREILRVTKRNGAVSLAVWGKNEVNPFSYTITNVLGRHLPSEPADQSAPGAFRFAETGVLAQILRDAGARDVKERLLQFQLAAPISAAEFWELRSEISGTLRTKLATLPKEQVDRIAQESLEAVREFFPNDQMNFPAEMIIVTGKK